MTYGPTFGPVNHPVDGPSYGTAATRPTTDPRAVHPLDWVLMAAGLLALVFSFFDFYTYRPKSRLKTACGEPGVPHFARALCRGTSEGAWSGVLGWLAVLLAVLGAVVTGVAVFAPHVRLPAPGRVLAFGAFGLAALGTLLALFIVPNYTVNGAVANGPHYGRFVEEGHGVSYWVILVLALVGLVAAFVRYQQTGAGLDEPPPRYGPPSAPSAYPPPGYLPPTYPTPPGYPPNAYPQPGPPQPGHPQPGHPQPGHPQPGHPLPQHPAPPPAYPAPGYPPPRPPQPRP